MAIISRFASAPSDISITVADDATLITTSLPSTCHSPVSSMLTRMRWPAPLNAFSTASRNVDWTIFRSLALDAASGDRLRRLLDDRSRRRRPHHHARRCATRNRVRSRERSALRPKAPASIRSCAPNPPRTAKYSWTRCRLRATQALLLLMSGTTDGLPAGRAAAAPAASLSNCSIGNRRCACAIFSRPSSRWKRCSCR